VSPLTLKLIQIGFLVLLWVLVLSVAAVMRNDLFARRRSRTRRSRRKAAAAAAVPAGVAAGAAGAAAATAGKAARAPKQPKPPKPTRPPKPKRGAPRELVVTAGTGEGSRVELGAEPVTIGRAAENTLVIDDDYVSGRHARFFPHEGAWVVEDLGSTNGTYLAKTRLTAPMVVPVGTPVRIGRTVVELRK
jgi:hypothetical protein